MEFSLVLLNKLISMSLMAVVGYVMVKVGTRSKWGPSNRKTAG